MKSFIDSNIILSAALFPGSIPAQALLKAAAPPNIAYVSDYSLDEVRRIADNKFPHKACDIEAFLRQLLLTVQLITTPADNNEFELSVSDVKDRPILRAAIFINAEFLITGDKRFLSADITTPKILNPREFLDV